MSHLLALADRTATVGVTIGLIGGTVGQKM
jgi:hypothetical protein